MRLLLYAPPLLLAATLAFPQEIDNAPAARLPALTIFDEIPDTAERHAFRLAWDADSPRDRRDRAEAFVAQYPRSIVLREAYELSSRAHAALGARETALERAERSLRLMPENPGLLVLAADLAATLKQLTTAEERARDALRSLAQAAAPASVAPAEEWPRSRNHLRAAAYFVLGRVATVRGEYADARRSLLMALSLNPDDLDALYTLAVVQMTSSQDSEAAAGFAHVMRAQGPLAREARKSLRQLHARRSPPALDFDTYVGSLHWTPPAPPARAPSPPAGAYAGSSACRECHAAVYERWEATGMSRMFRPYRAADIVGDFSGGAIVSNSARPIVEDGRHFIDVRENRNASWRRYPVDFVIGSKWQQAYATRLADARILVFPIQYNRRRAAWLNYWSLVDGPGSERADIGRFHTIPDGAIYQTACAPCHTSQLKFTEGLERAASAVFEQGGINCEMCHGPSQAHIERIRSGAPPSRAALDTPIRFGRLPAEQYLAVCSQCHAQSAVHDAAPSGSVNYSEQVPFYRTYPMHLPSSFSRKAFYRDGRHRATTFIAEAFARSQCFRKGNATCGSCHDPHPADAAANPTSLKFRDDPDRMCVQCHEAFREHPERHTRHAPASESSRCVSCHMPRIMDALLFPSRTHEIDDVPDAEMTARFGNEDSPNACLLCHREQKAEWVKRELGQYQEIKRF